jgi:hypothetical protein
MPTLSKKENFMRLINKQVPEYIPTYSLFWAFTRPPFMMGERNADFTGKDIFGVEQVIDKGGVVPAAMPKTSDFILTDITKWGDVVKLPELPDDSAWADMAKQAQDARDPEIPYGGGTSVGCFQPLVGMMGFTEGLSACFEEPEYVKEMLDYITTWAVTAAKKFIPYYQPEFGFLGDDIAHERNPFLSLPMFQELIAPYWKRYYDVFVEAGLPVGHHNCGHFELYLDDLVDMGVSFWDPVQASNDEDAIKAKYGNSLALCGGPEMRFWDDSTTKEQIRQELQDYCDRLAPGGGFAIFDFIYSEGGMPGASEGEGIRMGWLRDKFDEIKYDYY